MTWRLAEGANGAMSSSLIESEPATAERVTAVGVRAKLPQAAGVDQKHWKFVGERRGASSMRAAGAS